ncbi:MAG TPA: hypothetical protein VEY11_02550 [Pyrinomonadaceae bacterium]|nr:hypothetical protein [Pyrinomonadaceae bacterium]
MHDCRQTQDGLIDLVFDEANEATRARLLAEVERCAACAAEYRSYGATLDACDDVSAALSPGEGYWPQYHAALTLRLRGAATGARAEGAQTQEAATEAATVAVRRRTRASSWKRLLRASVRVPAPLAAAALLLLAATSIVSLALVARPAPEPVVLAAPDAARPESAPQIRFVEVPVVREKIVTQTIYLRRRADEGAPRGFAPRENLAGVARRNAVAPGTNGANAPAPRANFSGFKPAGEVNLRIIKGSEAHEQ